MNTITLNQLLDAIAKDGYTKAQRAYIRIEDEKINSACALGQGSLNLKIYPHWSAILPTDVYDFITAVNDHTSATVKEIAAAARNIFVDRLEEQYEIPDEFYTKFQEFYGAVVK